MVPCVFKFDMDLYCLKPHSQWKHCSSNEEREMIVSGKRWIKMCSALKHYSAGESRLWAC